MRNRERNRQNPLPRRVLEAEKHTYEKATAQTGESMGDQGDYFCGICGVMTERCEHMRDNIISSTAQTGRESMSDQACCAHLTVKYTTEPVGNGAVHGWWECPDCKTKFWPIAAQPTGECSVCGHFHQQGRVTCGHFIRKDPHQGEIACMCVAERVSYPRLIPEALASIKEKIEAGEAGQYEAAILWQELEKQPSPRSQLSCLPCGRIGEKAIVHEPSGQYVCVDCRDKLASSQASPRSAEVQTQAIKEALKAAVHLAIIRHDLVPEDHEDDPDWSTEEIAEDAANAAFGIENCAEEPIEEIKKLLAALPGQPSPALEVSSVTILDTMAMPQASGAIWLAGQSEARPSQPSPAPQLKPQFNNWEQWGRDASNLGECGDVAAMGAESGNREICLGNAITSLDSLVPTPPLRNEHSPTGPSQPSEGPSDICGEVFNRHVNMHCVLPKGHSHLHHFEDYKHDAEPSEGLEQVAREIIAHVLGGNDMVVAEEVSEVVAILARHFSGGKGAEQVAREICEALAKTKSNNGWMEIVRGILAHSGGSEGPGQVAANEIITDLMLALHYMLDMGGKLDSPVQAQMKKADKYLNLQVSGGVEKSSVVRHESASVEERSPAGIHSVLCPKCGESNLWVDCGNARCDFDKPLAQFLLPKESHD